MNILYITIKNIKNILKLSYPRYIIRILQRLIGIENISCYVNESYVKFNRNCDIYQGGMCDITATNN